MKSPRIVALLALALVPVGVVTVMTAPWTSGSGPAALSPAAIPAAPATYLEESPGRIAGDVVLAPSQSRREVASAAVPQAEPDLSEPVRAGSHERPQAATPAELAEFNAYVDATLAELRTEQVADSLRDIEKRTARMDYTIRTLENRLGLTPVQSGKLRRALLLRLDREAEYVWQSEQGADEAILGELKASDFEAHKRELSQFLTLKQLQVYSSQVAAGGW